MEIGLYRLYASAFGVRPQNYQMKARTSLKSYARHTMVFKTSALPFGYSPRGSWWESNPQMFVSFRGMGTDLRFVKVLAVSFPAVSCYPNTASGRTVMLPLAWRSTTYGASLPAGTSR